MCDGDVAVCSEWSNFWQEEVPSTDTPSEQNHCVLTASSAWSSSGVYQGSLELPLLELVPPVSLFREEADRFWKFKTSWKLRLLEVGKTDEHDFIKA